MLCVLPLDKPDDGLPGDDGRASFGTAPHTMDESSRAMKVIQQNKKNQIKKNNMPLQCI